MKPIKIILSTAFTVLSIFAFTLFSCSKGGDDGPAPVRCGSIYCTSGKICVNGSCVCPEGTYGDNCSRRKFDKYLGVWVVLEKGSASNTAQYSIQISADGTNPAKVNILNFGNRALDKLSCTFYEDKLTIPSQILDGRWEIEGEGIFLQSSTDTIHGKITMQYKVRDLTLPSTVPDDVFGYNGWSEPSVWTK